MKKKMNRNSIMAKANDIEKKSFKNGRYNVIREIGEGSFGQVYLAFDTQDMDRFKILQFTNYIKSYYQILVTLDKRCALKEIRQNIAINNDTTQIEKEINILKDSNNENIIKYKDHFIENKKIHIVTEYYKVCA
jgi:serine/threonine protein kinase